MKLLHGEVRDNKIFLEDKIDYPDGTKVMISITPYRSIKELHKKQLQILKRGSKLGGTTYHSRDEIHE
ncbi:MAG: hypothetical protein DRP11_02775 [Candidatus Aenigmatarchaeota archaeon]|nr:MAG: hypothetical protein DRP11_02775 [Candidatus Aenigmarchaeota archaeon]